MLGPTTWPIDAVSLVAELGADVVIEAVTGPLASVLVTDWLPWLNEEVKLDGKLAIPLVSEIVP